MFAKISIKHVIRQVTRRAIELADLPSLHSGLCQHQIIMHLAQQNCHIDQYLTRVLRQMHMAVGFKRRDQLLLSFDTRFLLGNMQLG